MKQVTMFLKLKSAVKFKETMESLGYEAVVKMVKPGEYAVVWGKNV